MSCSRLLAAAVLSLTIVAPLAANDPAAIATTDLSTALAARGLSLDLETSANTGTGASLADDGGWRYAFGAFDDAPADADGATSQEPAEHAEPAKSDATEIAKKLQNPVADLISVPLQYNMNTGVGPNDQVQSIFNIQPVIPFHVTDDWNLITRTIVPIINTPFPHWEAGLGDIQLSLFASPSAPSKFIWGAGPIFQFPSATNDILGTGKWSAGPTVVGLYMEGPWVLGALANQLWSFAGESDREHVSQMLIQPFVNYNFRDGWYASFSPIITANWEADSSNAWTVPIGAGVGKVFRIGEQILNAQIAPYYNVVSPDNGPEWTIRFQLTFVFPK